MNKTVRSGLRLLKTQQRVLFVELGGRATETRWAWLIRGRVRLHFLTNLLKLLEHDVRLIWQVTSRQLTDHLFYFLRRVARLLAFVNAH